ncbi:hypothetical protein, partial [Actinomyces sp. HMSC035G02]|uniref:hypothetical protein n=1 Tax=Actinomyces sp. HMSC035G02 TaxID=1739406 RepID=UPI001C40AB8C
SFFETTRKRCNPNDMNSKFELIAGELRATFLGNHDVAASKVIEGKQEDVRGGSGSYLPRARPRHPRAADRAQTNLARNFLRSFFETTRKRCNSNDANTMFEQVAGELRAKLMDGSGAWPGFEARRRTK